MSELEWAILGYDKREKCEFIDQQPDSRADAEERIKRWYSDPRGSRDVRVVCRNVGEWTDPTTPTSNATVGQAGSGELPSWQVIATVCGEFIDVWNDSTASATVLGHFLGKLHRTVNAAMPQPPVPAHDGFGEEYWRGHSAGRSEERERLEPSEDDRAALTDLIRNGLLGDDGIGVQYPRTDDGLPRDLARWIIDAGWRKPGSDDTTEGQAGSGEACWLCLGLGGVALHEVWTARRGKPLFTAHKPESDLHHVYPCPACAAQPPAPAHDTAEVLAGPGRRAEARADETYRELRSALGGELQLAGIYLDNDAEDSICEALIEHAEADRKVSCPECVQWSWPGPDAERKLFEHWERSHAPTAEVLAGLRESMSRAVNRSEAIALVEAAQARLADPVRGGGSDG